MRTIDKLLISAIARNETDAIAKALSGGANPNLTMGEMSLLTIAAVQGNLPLVELLLTSGANPNASDSYGNTALHTIAGIGITNGHSDVFDRLVKSGTNLSPLNNRGFTPLDFSAAYMNRRMAEKLQSAGAVCQENKDLLRELFQQQEMRDRSSGGRS